MRFEVRAIRGLAGVTALALEAADATDAARTAVARGYTVIAVRPCRSLPWLPAVRRRAFPLVSFSQELQSLLGAGLTLLVAVDTLAARERRPEVRAVLGEIARQLQEGRSFSHALEQCPAHFPPLFVAGVRASEKTGALAEALGRYVQYQLQVERVRRQVVSASVYPVLLAVVGGLVSLFMVGYVVPRFSHIYADIGRDLPWLSRVLMYWGQLIADHAAPVAAALAAGAAGTAALVARPGCRQWLFGSVCRLPGIGRRVHDYQLARFYRALGMLLGGGMPVVTALHMAMDLLQGSLRARLARAAAGIREGQAISQAMEAQQLTTPVALRLLMVGESTGRMGEMMERIAAFHEEDTARWVEGFTRLFEPLLMIFVGGVIGLIVLLMYMPIFELAGSIQ